MYYLLDLSSKAALKIVDFETRQNDFNMLAFEQCETNVY
jgi:hypothetical protein